MNITELQLNPRSREALRNADAPYELHRTLMRAFPDGNPESNRMLFRVEPGSDRFPGIRVLVQCSDAVPDWTHLPEDYCVEIRGPKPFDPVLGRGEILAFRLNANPTVKRAGKRWGLLREEEYMQWLERKGAAGGFEVLQASGAPYRLGIGWYKEPTKEYKWSIPHHGVRFEGMLRVIDSDALRRTLQAGVGSAKAFGFGLLTLARPL